MFKIPTITTIRKEAERCPLGEEIVVSKQRKNSASSSRENSREREKLKSNKRREGEGENDLEGIRRSLSMYEGRQSQDKDKKENKDKGQEPKSHSSACGCNECFKQEALKAGKLNENKVKELIAKFIKERDENTIKAADSHPKQCCCIHLKEKVKESKGSEKTILNQLTNTQLQSEIEKKDKNNQKQDG